MCDQTIARVTDEAGFMSRPIFSPSERTQSKHRSRTYLPSATMPYQKKAIACPLRLK
jgi:hypothetical protein